MTTNSRDPKGDRRTTGRSSAPKDDTRSQGSTQVARIDVSVHESEQELGRAIDNFCRYDHGYLKVRRSSLGSDLHLTWTWTLGSHAGTYVYIRVNYWEFATGLQLLARKLYEVDEGLRRPSPDKLNPGNTSA